MDAQRGKPTPPCKFCINCPFKKVKEPKVVVAVDDDDDGSLNINSLPKDILIKIFGYLKQNKLGIIARVCKTWNECIKCPDLWKKVERKVFGTPESKNEAVKEIIQDLSFWTTHIKLNFRYMTDQLMFEDISMTLQKQCCHLHTLIFCDTELSVNLQSIINLCAHFLQNVRVLVLRNSKFGSNPVNGEYNEISKLEVLDVRRCFPASGNRPLFSIMPHLKKLCLADVVQIDDFWFEDDFSFLSQLEVLDLGNTMIHIDTFLALQARALNLIELYLCRTIIWNAALMEFVFPKLKTICLNFCYYVNYEGIVSIIESCPSLQNIYVKEKVAESYAKCDFVDQNESKLEVVKVANSDNHFMLKDYLYG